MKKVGVVGFVAVALLLAFLVTRRRCGGNEAKLSSGSATPKHATVGAASQHIDDVPAWLSQINVKPRKIAGKVVFAGKPVEGAVVHLALDAHFGVFQRLGDTRTGPDGMFDFGPWTAALFNVSAEAEGRKPAQITFALANPKIKPDQLILKLGDCSSRLYGSVLDASGGVIPKAKIRVAGLAGVETDANGKYQVCVEPRGQLLRAEADGYGTIAVFIEVPGELRYDFVLVPEAVVVGQVITEDKRPVPGARVIALPDPSEFPHHIASGWAISDQGGRFSIPGLSPGHYRLTATADGLATKSAVDATVQAGTATRDTILVVTATARVNGHVMMGDKPIAGAMVSVLLGGPRPRMHGDQGNVAASQEDGSFVLQDVPFGKISFAAPPYRILAPEGLEVKAATVDNIKIEVAALASIHGTVTRSGQPATDAIVEVPQFGPVNVDDSGQYRVDGLSPGAIRLIASSAESKAFTLTKPVTVAAGEDKLVDIELNFAGRARGIVVDQSGKPVPAVYVRLHNSAPDKGDSMTNARGEFDAGSMSGGDYRASVYPSPMAGQRFEFVAGDQIIKVPQDGIVDGIKLTIKYETCTLSGTVVDDAAAPVADVHVEAIGHGGGGIDVPSGMSTADGTFLVKNLPCGTNYNLHAHAFDGSEGDAIGVAAGVDNITVRLMRPGALEGTLVGFSTVPEVSVRTLTPDLFIGSSPIVEGTHFSQTGLRPGKYTIEAKSGTESDGASVEVKSGETATVTLTSRGTGRVEGALYEFGTRTALPGYRCDANLSMGGEMGGPPADPSQMGYPDEKGNFAMAAPVGMVRVFCFPQGNPGVTVAGTDVEVTKSASAHVEIYGVRVKAAANAGIRLQPLTLPLVINAVDPNSVAAKQGIKVGDRVVTIDAAPVLGLLPEGVMALIGNHTPGTTVSIGIDRGGTLTEYKLSTVATPN